MIKSWAKLALIGDRETDTFSKVTLVEVLAGRMKLITKLQLIVITFSHLLYTPTIKYFQNAYHRNYWKHHNLCVTFPFNSNVY